MIKRKLWGECLAHRLSYKTFVGPLSDTDVVRHKCDNPQCVNPNHLETGTHLDNMLDRFKRDRLGGKSRLNNSSVLEIVKSTSSNAELAQHYGVTTAAIRNVRSGRTWYHVTGLPRLR